VVEVESIHEDASSVEGDSLAAAAFARIFFVPPDGLRGGWGMSRFVLNIFEARKRARLYSSPVRQSHSRPMDLLLGRSIGGLMGGLDG